MLVISSLMGGTKLCFHDYGVLSGYRLGDIRHSKPKYRHWKTSLTSINYSHGQNIGKMIRRLSFDHIPHLQALRVIQGWVEHDN